MHTTTATAPVHCQHRDARFPVLGCARVAGHDGSHWLTSQAAAANADLRRQGFFAATCGNCDGPMDERHAGEPCGAGQGSEYLS